MQYSFYYRYALQIHNSLLLKDHLPRTILVMVLTQN